MIFEKEVIIGCDDRLDLTRITFKQTEVLISDFTSNTVRLDKQI